MKKLITRIKEDKALAACAVVCMVVFVLTLIQNFLTPFVSDDWCYMFVYEMPGNPTATSERVNSLFDIFRSMKNHWNLCNGRLVAHGLLQAVLATSYPGIMHKVIFNIVNSLVFVLLGIVISLHASHKNKNSNALLLACVYLMMWFFLPQYGATVLWASGAASYLWCATILLFFLLPYRRYALDHENIMKDNLKNEILMGIFGLFAGCTNENSGGAIAFTCILFVIFYKTNKIKIPKWSFSGIVGTIIGTIVLISSPSNDKISTPITLDLLAERMKEIVNKSSYVLFGLLVTFAIVVIFVVITNGMSKDDNKRKVLPLIYILGALSSIGVLIFSDYIPERAWFFAVCLTISMIGYYYEKIDFKMISKVIPKLVAVTLIVIFTLSYFTTIKELHNSYEQTRLQLDTIYEAKENGRSDVKIVMVKRNEHKRDVMSKPNGVASYAPPSNTWVNAWSAKYFGLDRISAIDLQQ